MTAYQRLLQAEAPRVNARKDQQISCTDLIVANSDFVRDSFVEAGVSPERVVTVPTGCPPLAPWALEARDGLDKRMIFVCAGTQSIRKGIPYLLDAWRQLGPSARSELWLVGRMELPKRLVSNLPRNVIVRGPLPRSELTAMLRQASVLVLPTLAEGRAHIILEALASGLAVITTRNSGCTDLVQHEWNGITVPIRDAEALAESMTWCIDHPREVASMQQRSAHKAARWQQGEFLARHGEVVRKVLQQWL